MTTEKMVNMIFDELLADRKAAGTPEFWETFYTDTRIEDIARRIDADRKVVELTLALMDADYTANNAQTRWCVYENDQTKEVVSSHEKGIGWTEIASFNGYGFGHNVRELDEDFENMEFPKVWDEYLEYWGGDCAEQYAQIIDDEI